MAKIKTETIVLTISKLVKDTDESPSNIVDDSMEQTLADLVSELVADNAAIVEVQRIDENE